MNNSTVDNTVQPCGLVTHIVTQNSKQSSLRVGKQVTKGIRQRSKQNKTVTYQQTPQDEVRFNALTYVSPLVFTLSPQEYASTVAYMWPLTAIDCWEENKEVKKMYDVVKASTLPNYLHTRLPVNSGLKIDNWRKALRNYTDVQLVDFLEFGWPIDFTALTTPLSQHFKTMRRMKKI